MRKFLLFLIAILIGLILACVLFFFGLNITRSNNPPKGEEEKTVQYRPEIPKGEKKEAVEKEETVEKSEDVEAEYTETVDEETSADEWYRVRKSPDDASTQKGAFKSLENAKKLADEHKSEGYKVYNGNKCVYTP